MTKIRVLIFLLTLIIVGFGGYFAMMYARGYRINTEEGKITPHGLLVAKSSPDGAQIFIDHELKSATDTTVSLSPDVYEIEIKKEGYKTWFKSITIKKEEVTEFTASLFKSAPSLSALTFSGVINPVASQDMTKIAYAVLPENKSDYVQKAGLWVMETINLPVGFSREPRRVTDGDLSKASWDWSPDGREILVTTETATYLLNSGTYTQQGQRVNVTGTKNTILKEWEIEEEKRMTSKTKNLPSDLVSILETRASEILFSPDEQMLVYIASGSATLPTNLIKQLPGSSTQKEDRNIERGKTYLYDIKEDKNFLIDEDSKDLLLGSGTNGEDSRKIMWFPNSRNIVLSEKGRVTIMDYDGTNRQIIFTGGFINPFVFTTVSEDRLLVLTDLGGNESPNLYTLSIK
ncbi:MAG: Serine/threonine protein kinase [Candidatus Woesebacteria bacterium GW2011_GWC1_38_13]|uniref:PEGA domain protein n=4 Tax=Candidatus Woeseibacteriota TaxID=1752722 RepID=A0A0G0P1M5_9BACT|nr:MAG: Serine/threonine protein kinase [Candidatus Woesebacteria bacterium GW2011_GWC1_38_13]KKQ83191.1 MAG: PEGA domain protein [Candidatus Woesebacteria bacterium GW2011_GWA1_38_8]